jgi:small subunit ribosomal protein S6
LREYELAVLISPDVAEDEVSGAFDRVKQLVASRGGEVVSDDQWGRRKLAHPIGKYIEGSYVISQIKMPPDRIRDLEAGLDISDEVLRHLVIRKSD